jgi:DNA-binding GntR family transcriptional regulator
VSGATKTLVAQHRTKSELALEAMREGIFAGAILPGARLTIAELSELLGMSSTPIREAIRVLEADGLVVYEPHRGVWVRTLTVAQAEELGLLRAPMEGLATRLAVPNLDAGDVAHLEELQEQMAGAARVTDDATLTRANAEWHRHIYAAAGTTFVFRHIMRLWMPYPWTRVWDSARREAALVQHAEILAAIRFGDAVRAGELMHDHILFQCQSAASDLAAGEPAT